MRDSTRSQAKVSDALLELSGSVSGAAAYAPRPRTMGFFVMLISALSFIAGGIKNEPLLALLGTVFLIILVYCFLAVFFSGLICRGKSRALSIEIIRKCVGAGEEAEFRVNSGGIEAKVSTPRNNRFLRLPALLIRCELRLRTHDGRVIRRYIDPDFERAGSFSARERGAYFSDERAAGSDRLVISDAPGLFALSFPLRGDSGERLLVLPGPAETPLPLSSRSGGSAERNEIHYRKSDALTDHRPYIPGDDPRRINWKLYGHAPLGELFVREGEPEPPPHSRLLILVDTEADISLYSENEARTAVDILCESALASALEYSRRGMDILVGYTGGGISGGEGEVPMDAPELAKALAFPAAILRQKDAPARGAVPGARLPEAPADTPVLILALPRIPAEGAPASEAFALDNFLKKREAGQGADIVFLCGAKGGRAAERKEAARICVELYTRKAGVHARKEEHAR